MEDTHDDETVVSSHISPPTSTPPQDQAADEGAATPITDLSGVMDATQPEANESNPQSEEQTESLLNLASNPDVKPFDIPSAPDSNPEPMSSEPANPEPEKTEGPSTIQIQHMVDQNPPAESIEFPKKITENVERMLQEELEREKEAIHQQESSVASQEAKIADELRELDQKRQSIEQEQAGVASSKTQLEQEWNEEHEHEEQVRKALEDLQSPPANN